MKAFGEKLGGPLGRVAFALLVVVVVVVVLLTRGSGSYRVAMVVPDAGQMVTGNLVKVGSASIGTVSKVRLAENGQAELVLEITDDAYKPLHRGTQAIIRNSSLSSIANRFVSLEVGPQSAAEIADGGRIGAQDTRAATDIDQVLTLFAAQGQRGLQTLIRGGAKAFSDLGPQTRELITALSPALAQTAKTVEQVSSDDADLERFVVRGSALASVFAAQRGDLEQGLVATAGTVRAASAERRALSDALRRTPGTLRQANVTLADARGLLRDAGPVVRDARPVASRLATTLRLVRPFTAEARPLLADVDRSLPVLTESLRRLPPLERSAEPALRDVARALRSSDGIVDEALPYVPDVVSGLLTSFGGKSSGLYDANGHSTRIALQVNSQNLPPALRGLSTPLDALSPLLGSGFTTFESKHSNRCPGGSGGIAQDGSAPWPAGLAGTCDPNHTAPGARR
jgi:phospholipid/cholesterol/gamma-HCH transport system substrate-binding protein